jgi:serine/threonine protein kinase
MLQDGDCVGRYEIRGIIGEGGFGNVYKAWDDQLQRFVAIKELRSELKAKSETQYEKYRERFALESRIQSQFEDVPIVRSRLAKWGRIPYRGIR